MTTEDLAIGIFEDGFAAQLDLDRLIGTHLCIQGNSGAGKSGAIRRLLEVTHGRLQHIVLDVEDEFYTLREKYEYMIAGGDNGDCAANVNNAEALALMILRTGFSAIIQINNLHIEERREFIALFLDALIGAPKDLWHPALVVLDESQMYAPQVGTVGSSAAVISLMTLGRKRGFTGVLATPRISSISKDATGPVNNWLMGRIGQPADRRTTADALGFRANSDEARGLLKMKTRQFWAFGPALCLEPTRLMIGDAETTVIKAGQAAVPTPPAPAAMRKMLEQLNAAAVKDAEATKAAVAAVREGTTGTGVSLHPEDALQEAHAAGRAEGDAAGYARGVEIGRQQTLEDIAERLRVASDNIASVLDGTTDMFGEVRTLNPPTAAIGEAVVHSPRAIGDGSLTGAMLNTLQALAWWAAIGVTAPTKKQLAAMMKIDPVGSTMRARLAELSKADLVEYPQPGIVRLTPAGKKAAPQPDRSATLIQSVRSSLSEAELQTFNALPAKPGSAIAKQTLAGLLNVDAGGSTLRARLAALSGRELIEYPKPGWVTRQEWVVGQ